MVTKEILGGLRLALNRGESLQKAMTTFYNAGYKKEEIEAAARMIQQEKVQTPPQIPLKKPIKQKKVKPIPQTKSVKKVSAYDEPVKKPKRKLGKWLLIIVIAIAVVFLGLLIAFLLST